MIDPTVEQISNNFVATVMELNALWSELQKHDVYVRLETETSSGGSKRMVIKEIKQSVQYPVPGEKE